MTTCRICGQPTEFGHLDRTINSYALQRCRVCGTVHVAERPAQRAHNLYNGLFDGDVYQQHRMKYERLARGRKPHRPYDSWLLRKAEKRCQGRRMVEIGGGNGEFGLIAQSRGWKYIDFDISEVAVQWVRSLKLKAQTIEGDVPNIPKGSADLVVMWEVIEHIWNVAEYLAAISNALGPNGVLLLSTPNWFRSCYQRSNDLGASGPPIHINFFSPESLQATLFLTGFHSVNLVPRRLWRPSSLSARAVIRSIKMLLGTEAPPTLYALASTSSQAFPRRKQ